jgi:hypothetical protein
MPGGHPANKEQTDEQGNKRENKGTREQKPKQFSAEEID